MRGFRAGTQSFIGLYQASHTQCARGRDAVLTVACQQIIKKKKKTKKKKELQAYC